MPSEGCLTVLRAIGSHGRLRSKGSLLRTCLYFLEPQIMVVHHPPTPAAPSPRPLAKVGGGIRLRRALAAICMQIVWNAMQMRDLMQMYALLGGRPRPSPH